MLKHKHLLTAVILFLSPALHAQKDAKFSEEMKQEMCTKVKLAAQHAWKGYKDYAWGADDLKPLTKTSKTWYKKSMLMTPVDAFDTFTLLGLKTEAKEAKDLILTKLDFNIDNDVQVFEITIRLLGGLITAYELDGNKKFLTLAKNLGDRLMPSLKNVQTFEKTNSMESFFFGETLKYAYLIFAPETTFDFKKVVVTTEAHPF